jgi:hypothetical protein
MRLQRRWMGFFANEGMKQKILCYWASIDWQSIESVHIERSSLKRAARFSSLQSAWPSESRFSNLSASRCGYSRPAWWFT